MPDEQRHSIKLSDETYQRLLEHQRPRETLDELVARLLGALASLESAAQQAAARGPTTTPGPLVIPDKLRVVAGPQ